MPDRRVLLSLLLLAGGCSSGEADYNRVDVPEREAEAAAAIERAVASNGAASTARLGVPVSTPTPSAARGRAFPPEFRGYWGATPDDCELANTEATGRIAVEADTIRFFGLRARVEQLREESPAAVTALLALRGEGQRWRRTDRLMLEAGGTTLVRAEQPSGATVRYQRC